jgi:tRNA uridine 5-carbamoylmethylation protein Kti12
MRLIQFIGRNKVGKTTLANSLAKLLFDKFNIRSVVMSYADHLRTEIVEIYGIPKDIVFDKYIDKNSCMIRLGDYDYDPGIIQEWIDIDHIDELSDFPNIVISLRELLITHSTKIRRWKERNYWTNKFNDKLYYLTRTSPSIQFVIVDDARYTNELNFPDQMQTIFWLENDTNLSSTDIAQDAILKWYSDNEDRAIYIQTVVPLTEYDVWTILMNKVIPRLSINDTYFETLLVSSEHEKSDINIST